MTSYQSSNNHSSEEDKHLSGDEKTFSPSDIVEKAIVEEKSIGVEKAEILANQWKHTFWFKLLLGFSAFLCGYAYGLDSQTRYVYTAYATASWSEHSLLTTVNAIMGWWQLPVNPSMPDCRMSLVVWSCLLLQCCFTWLVLLLNASCQPLMLMLLVLCCSKLDTVVSLLCCYSFCLISQV